MIAVIKSHYNHTHTHTHMHDCTYMHACIYIHRWKKKSCFSFIIILLSIYLIDWLIELLVYLFIQSIIQLFIYICCGKNHCESADNKWSSKCFPTYHGTLKHRGGIYNAIQISVHKICVLIYHFLNSFQMSGYKKERAWYALLTSIKFKKNNNKGSCSKRPYKITSFNSILTTFKMSTLTHKQSYIIIFNFCKCNFYHCHCHCVYWMYWKLYTNKVMTILERKERRKKQQQPVSQMADWHKIIMLAKFDCTAYHHWEKFKTITVAAIFH